MKLYYLGPLGSFTYQAALQVSAYVPDVQLASCGTERELLDHIERGEGQGILAWENNVEGYVAPNLDKLIDAHNVAGIGRISVDVIFDAYVCPDHTELTEVTAHPHGLAQCLNFTQERGLRPVPAHSNTAACENLEAHQVALAPRGNAERFALDVYAQGVQDYSGAHTDFLHLASRDDALRLSGVLRENNAACESILTVIPLYTGPGVIANLLDVFRDNGVNMTSLISRPIKAVDGTYSFIITLDAAPWDASMSHVLDEVRAHGDWVKILAVYPRYEVQKIPVVDWNLPHLGVNPMLDMSYAGEER
ncbi:prephenate dehydratase [Alloscardovia macacae]|uniref:Prephenate dehydratase n=1 Tax=Alloscardovia macacae TaxID=1160091 RepID=A0A261F1Z4_9BIFI|nr:prephenate dehydratase domain-containing protein [Alloscardovia macacae]OZG53137.1 prephenate dehydratase [Alloscardovia macacae]